MIRVKFPHWYNYSRGLNHTVAVSNTRIQGLCEVAKENIMIHERRYHLPGGDLPKGYNISMQFFLTHISFYNLHVWNI